MLFVSHKDGMLFREGKWHVYKEYRRSVVHVSIRSDVAHSIHSLSILSYNHLSKSFSAHPVEVNVLFCPVISQQ